MATIVVGESGVDGRTWAISAIGQVVFEMDQRRFASGRPKMYLECCNVGNTSNQFQDKAAKRTGWDFNGHFSTFKVLWGTLRVVIPCCHTKQAKRYFDSCL